VDPWKLDFSGELLDLTSWPHTGSFAIESVTSLGYAVLCIMSERLVKSTGMVSSHMINRELLKNTYL